MTKIKLLALVIMGSFVGCTAQNENIDSNNQTTMTFKIQKSEDEWRKSLTPEQYYIIRQKGTERPHTGEFNMFFEDGIYHCAACNAPLFASDSKFDAHCGWPSFDKAISDSAIVEQADYSHGMARTEIMCGSCGGHLGHVFDDGPTETGLRYCVNSISIGFEGTEKEDSKK
jgi:peptide-methionine (R)-S-oxide reductase